MAVRCIGKQIKARIAVHGGFLRAYGSGVGTETVFLSEVAIGCVLVERNLECERHNFNTFPLSNFCEALFRSHCINMVVFPDRSLRVLKVVVHGASNSALKKRHKMPISHPCEPTPEQNATRI